MSSINQYFHTHIYRVNFSKDHTINYIYPKKLIFLSNLTNDSYFKKLLNLIL